MPGKIDCITNIIAAPPAVREVLYRVFDDPRVDLRDKAEALGGGKKSGRHN